jgi:hypothetical protein
LTCRRPRRRRLRVVVVVVFVVVVANTQNTPYRGVTVRWGRPLTALSRLASLPRRTLRLWLKAQDGGRAPTDLAVKNQVVYFCRRRRRRRPVRLDAF